LTCTRTRGLLAKARGRVPDRSGQPVADTPMSPGDRKADLAALPPDPHRLPPKGSWFGPDAERHLLDRPKFCPMCAADVELEGGISTEYWAADLRVFMTWCGDCGWFGEITRFDIVTITEEEH
jgi:hypothetical protein